ncbi:hypothetical protein [Paractinoplanes hotanensis]|uniref:Uncharacterized protein n=1 Tax=Paractinoplanes hotanensis TaxID=2906497 RepID=A0ABT0XY33_9ACTN|nr:hypothetical protein [Actinoplanes hotanensis]MCM4078627.1 hypothetical protein [Actinoplanes hotanensis]
MTAPGSFTLQVPGSWLDYDLAQQDFARQQQELRSEMTTPEQRRAADDALLQARRLLRAARRRGAVSAAGLIARDEDGLLMAFVAVFGVTVPEGMDLSIAEIAQQLSRPAGADGYGDRTVTAVQLPEIGSVARITGTETVALTDETSAVMVAMHTVIPLPDQPGSYLVVTGMSPNLALAESLYDIFDAITGTFRFVGDVAVPAGEAH